MGTVQSEIRDPRYNAGIKSEVIKLVTQKEYNGWTNYETWLMALWIGNDQGFDQIVQEMAEDYRHDEIYNFADSLKSFVEDLPEVSEVVEKSGFVSDLLGAALSEIDWYEIAEHYHADLEPEEAEESEEVPT